MSIYFVTGNKDKFEEVRSVLPDIEMFQIDIPEIQEMDAQKIIAHKLQEALKIQAGEFIVEDTSLYLDALHGLPGPFIKWFLETMGCDGIANIAAKFKESRATAKTIIGYTKKHSAEIKFFEGVITGKIVAPRGELGFGWDPIFVPDGHSKTFAEMGVEERLPLKMRRFAALKLKEFLRV